MQKFLLKILTFLSPFLFLQVFTSFFYSKNGGDLIRLGYILDTNDSGENFKKEYNRKIYYTNLSELDFEENHDFTVLTIGDSFSQPTATGYKNYLAEEEGITVVHFDRNVNAFLTLSEILNGNILETVEVQYIIVQAVERHIVERAYLQDERPPLCTESIKEILNVKPEKREDQTFLNQLESGLFLTFPLYNVLYFFDDNAFDSQTYRLNTTKKLFSNYSKEGLFYYMDIENLKHNHNLKGITNLNQKLNQLASRLRERGIKLIVLPSPDKYDFYYEYLMEKDKYPEPKFFDLFEKEEKDYLYLNSKKLLKEKGGDKDVYFYDDTHWSPIAAKVIAEELAQMIKSDR